MTSPLASTVLLFVILMQLSRNFSDAWLAHWVTDSTLDTNKNDTGTLDHLVVASSHATDNSNSTVVPPHSTGYYLGIFASLALTNSVLTMARAFLFAYAGIKAAKFIHDRLLNKVMFVSRFLN